jgi:hypothetical protein
VKSPQQRLIAALVAALEAQEHEATPTDSKDMNDDSQG